MIKYKVRVDDINYGNHMGNERALIAFQQGRIELLESFGASELNVGDGCGLIQMSSYVEYLKEVRMGEILDIKISLEELKGPSMTLRYDVFSKENKVFFGTTKFLAYDYENKKVRRFPREFVKKIKELKVDNGGENGKNINA